MSTKTMLITYVGSNFAHIVKIPILGQDSRKDNHYSPRTCSGNKLHLRFCRWNCKTFHLTPTSVHAQMEGHGYYKWVRCVAREIAGTYHIKHQYVAVLTFISGIGLPSHWGDQKLVFDEMMSHPNPYSSLSFFLRVYPAIETKAAQHHQHLHQHFPFCLTDLYLAQTASSESVSHICKH